LSRPTVNSVYGFVFGILVYETIFIVDFNLFNRGSYS
jgi:hypothetical protein